MSYISDMKTKELLIQSAIEVLIGDPSSNLEAIANKAGVNKRTLHRYFGSRDAMIKACGESIMGNILNDVSNAIEKNKTPLDQLHQMFIDDLAKGQHFEFCMKFSSHFKSEELQTQFKEMGVLFNGVLDTLKLNGIFDLRFSNDWLSYLWMGIISSVHKALSDGVIAPKDAADLGWESFIRGASVQN